MLDSAQSSFYGRLEPEAGKLRRVSESYPKTRIVDICHSQNRSNHQLWSGFCVASMAGPLGVTILARGPCAPQTSGRHSQQSQPGSARCLDFGFASSERTPLHAQSLRCRALSETGAVFLPRRQQGSLPRAQRLVPLASVAHPGEVSADIIYRFTFRLFRWWNFWYG